MKYDLGPLHRRIAAQARGSSAVAKNQLQDIEDALERLDKGRFGYCEQCGCKLSMSRLCADPTTSLCRRCQDGDES